MKRGGRLNPVSDKRAAWNAKYTEARDLRIQAQIDERGSTYCEVGKQNCRVEPHHPNGRLNENIMNFLLVAIPLHRWIHENGREARELGLLAK